MLWNAVIFGCVLPGNSGSLSLSLSRGRPRRRRRRRSRVLGRGNSRSARSSPFRIFLCH
jgi:hypothetical protein